ncbi:MAG: MoaD/ThiS family protein [Theionarchaea archaeon]|nr:MoaD/ThiS family protein [Theionarchaea archaeon]
MDDLITVRVKNILGTEETDVQISGNATVGQLIQHAAPQLQINPQGATIMYQGQQLPPEQPLNKMMIRDGDAVMIAPGSIVGGGCAGLPFDLAFQVAAPVVAGVVANYLYDRLHGIDLKELTKRLLIGTFTRNKDLIQEKIQYEKISERIAELLHQQLTDWKRINEKHGIEILEKLLPEGGMNGEELWSMTDSDSEFAETLGKMIASGKVEIQIQLKESILKDIEDLLREMIQNGDC